ncbi:protein of unknown function [Acidithiobacillus ferrivorans]|uniref:Uncharacterized protein n=1 Tax=Acidithiobacillus ferrivorans TaxID=160808 RepID=A0A060UR81_9PROT|nr:hypothetical protein AFERRI_150049 [Acidithiobacillus ferrivorans]SMH65625.1 protein of unknown function [Acidithiobacillus ferrivorans]
MLRGRPHHGVSDGGSVRVDRHSCDLCVGTAGDIYRPLQVRRIRRKGWRDSHAPALPLARHSRNIHPGRGPAADHDYFHASSSAGHLADSASCRPPPSRPSSLMSWYQPVRLVPRHKAASGGSLFAAVIGDAAYNTAWQLFPNQGAGRVPYACAGHRCVSEIAARRDPGIGF